MKLPEGITWWKILVALLLPPACATAIGISMTGFLVIFNFFWTAVGVETTVGNVYSLLIITLALAVLYLMHRRSPYAKIWFTLPAFSAVLTVVIAVSTFGLSANPAFRIMNITLVVALWVYCSWVVWGILAEY